MSWYRDNQMSWYDKNNPYERRRQRNEELDNRFYQRERGYDDRYSERLSRHETQSYNSARRWPDSRERDYSQGATRGYSQRDRGLNQGDREYNHRDIGYIRREREYSQRGRDDGTEIRDYGSRERTSRRDENLSNQGTSESDRYSLGTGSTIKKGYPSGDRSQGHRGFSPGDRPQRSLQKEHTSDRLQGHRGYSLSHEAFSPGKKDKNALKKEYNAERVHKGYSPGETRATSSSNRRAGASRERTKIVPDDVECNHLRSQEPVTRQCRLTEAEDTQETFVKEQELDFAFRRNELNSDINKNIHPIKSQGKVTIDYGHKSRGSENQPTDLKESLSFDNHLAQLTLMNAFAQKLGENAPREPTSSILFDSNPEECKDSSSSSVTHTPSDSNPVFHNVISGVTEIHIDNKTINVNIAHEPRMETVQPDIISNSVPSGTTIEDKLLNVKGNINNLLSQLQSKLGCEKETGDRKTNKTSTRNYSQAIITSSEKSAMKPSHSSIPGFEQWDDEGSDNFEINNDQENSKTHLFLLDQDLSISKCNNEIIGFAEKNPLRQSVIGTIKNPQEDSSKDIDYREIFDSEHTATVNLANQGIKEESMSKDNKPKHTKIDETENKPNSMSEEELRLEFQRRWENKDKDTKEGIISSCIKEDSDVKIDTGIIKDEARDQVQKKFQKRWENEQVMSGKGNVDQVYNRGTDSTNFSRQTHKNFNDTHQNVQFPGRNRQRSGSYPSHRNLQPESQQGHRKQGFGPSQVPKIHGTEPYKLQRHQGHFANRNDTRPFNQVNRQGTHGNRNNPGNFQRNLVKSFSGRQLYIDATQEVKERQTQSQSDIEGVSRAQCDRGHQQTSIDERKNKPIKQCKHEHIRQTDNRIKSREQLSENMREESVQQINSDKHKSHDKSSNKSLKGFRIPKLGVGQAVVKRQSVERETNIKTKPKQLSVDCDSDINTIQNQHADMKEISSTNISSSLPRNTPPKEGPTNIFEKLSLEITPPKQKKASAEKKQPEVEQTVSKSFKDDSYSSSDSNSSGMLCKLEHFIGKTKFKRQKDEITSTTSEDINNKKDTDFELKDKSFLSIKGMREINGQLYWRKVKLCQPKIVVKKLTRADIERKSQVKNSGSQTNPSADQKEKNSLSRKIYEESSSVKKLKKTATKTVLGSENSESIENIPPNLKNVIDNVTDSDSEMERSSNYLMDTSEESSPVKQKKKAVQILSESEDSEITGNAQRKSIDENVDFIDGHEKKDYRTNFSKDTIEDNSPVKRIRKSVQILSDSEDLEMIEDAQAKLWNKKHCDAENGDSTYNSVEHCEIKSSVKQTNKAVQILSESDDAELLKDDISDGEYMEIGSDEETQELNHFFEPIEDTFETFEDDIGSAIAESLENESPTTKLAIPELKTKEQNKTDCVTAVNLQCKAKEPKQKLMQKLEEKSEIVEKKKLIVSPPKTSSNPNKSKPICLVRVSLGDDNDIEEEEEQSQSLFANEPKTNSPTKQMPATTERSQMQTEVVKKEEDGLDASNQVQNNVSAKNEEKVNKVNESEDDLPVIKRKKIKPRARAVSISFDSEADKTQKNEAIDTKITPRKKKLFKHKKVVYAKKEVSGNEGDVEDNECNLEESTQRYEWDGETQDYDNKIGANVFDTFAAGDFSKKDEEDGGKAEVKDEPDWLKSGYTQEPETVFISDDSDDDMVITASQPVISLDSSDSEDTKNNVKTTPSIKRELNVRDDETVHDPDYWDFSSPDNDSDKGSDFEADDFFKMVSRLSETTQADSDEDMGDKLPEIDLDIFSDDGELLEQETQKQSKHEFEDENNDQKSNEIKDINNEYQNDPDEVVNQSAGRQTITEHADGVDIFIEEMDDNDTLESSWSEDSYLSDLDAYEKITAQSTQKFPDSNGQVKSMSRNNQEGEVMQSKVSLVKEKNPAQKSNVHFSQTEAQPFDSEKTVDYSAETQEGTDKSLTMSYNSDSNNMVKGILQNASDTEDYTNSSQINIIHICGKKLETHYDQGDTQVLDANLKDIYYDETQIDQELSESAEDDRRPADYSTATQNDIQAASSEYEIATQLDSQQAFDLYQAETQVLSDSVENENFDDSYKGEKFSSSKAENTHDDPQYELYLRKGDMETKLNISGRLEIKVDYSFHNKKTDLHYSDDMMYSGENKGKGANDVYLAETQLIETAETESRSDNENDAYLEETQVYKNRHSNTDESEGESNDPYFAATQQIDTSIISITSENENRTYIEQTQVDTETVYETEENEIKEMGDPYLAETQHMEIAEINDCSDYENGAYMAETQVDREAVNSADDSVDTYSDLTQQDNTNETNSDSNTSDRIYGMSTQIDPSSKSMTKLGHEIETKDTFRKTILSLKKGIKRSTDLLSGKRSYSLKDSGQTKQTEIYKAKNNDDDQGSPVKKQRLNIEETVHTENKIKGMSKAKEASIQSKDSSRKSILIEPLSSTSFYGSSSSIVPPARTQSFLDAAKNIITTDASKDDTWLSKKTSKDKGKGKSGKRRRNKSSESALDMKELISKARQGYQERQMKFKKNPECIADPTKKFKHQTSGRSLDADEDVELPTFSQVIGMGIPLLDQSMLLQSRTNKEPVKTVQAEVTTSSSSIVTSTVTMATSTSSVTEGSTVHISISSTSASTSVSYTAVNNQRLSKSFNSPVNFGDSNTYKLGKLSDTGDKFQSNIQDKINPKSGSEQLSEIDKQNRDNCSSTKSNDTDKRNNKHLSNEKDNHKLSTREKEKSDDKHTTSSDHKARSKYRHSSSDKHSHSNKHKSYSNKHKSNGDKHSHSDKSSSDRPSHSDKHKSSSDNHKLSSDELSHSLNVEHKTSDKHKHESDKPNPVKSDQKNKRKDEHRSHKHKHKTSQRHDKDGDGKHDWSKEHRSEKTSRSKTVDKHKADVSKHKASKVDSSVSDNKVTGPTIDKESDKCNVPQSGKKEVDKGSLKNNFEQPQVRKDTKNDEEISVLVSKAKQSNLVEFKERNDKHKKDKNKLIENNSSVGITDEQVPSTSKGKEVIHVGSSGSENTAAVGTSGKGLTSCLSVKSAEHKKKRTVTWGNNTVHGSQTQTNTQKTCILSISAKSLMEKITPGPPLPVAQTVTYPPDLMKINERVTWEKIIAIILKWNPSWFEERDKMEASGIKKCPPPPVAHDISSSGLFQLVDKYISLEEYVNKFMLPLLMHETWQTLYTDWREKKTRGKLSKLYFLLNQHSNYNDRLQEYHFIGVMTREERKQWSCLNEGDLLTLRMEGMERTKDKCQNVPKFILAVVVSVSYKESRKDVDRICQHVELGKYRKPDSIGVILAVNVRKRLFTPHGITEIQPVSSLVSTKRQITALAYFPRSPLCRDLLFPSSNATYSDRAVASLPHDRKELNQSQSVAVNTVVKIVSRVATTIPRICLLQGPPGTGKSFTIINIIRRIVQEKKGKCSICLTAPSHAAVDELLRKIHRQNLDTAEKTKIHLVRLGKKHSIHPDVQCYCLDSMVQKRLMEYVPQSLLAERNTLENKISSIRKNIKSTKDKFQIQKWSNDLRRLQKDKENLEAKFQIDRNQVNPGQEKRAKSEILNGAHVIAGTLSSMGSALLKNFLSQNNMFDCVIVDEATQAVEVDTLIPLQYSVSKLILVGDPEQLCPTVISQVAQDHKLNMSLFQRLDSHFRYNTGSINPVIFLDTQYRMDREIACFPNNYIYEGRLKSDTPASKYNLVPYLLYDIREGEEQFSQGSRSMSNQMEAVFTAELCKLILQETKFVERSIGIIAPYAKQKDEILKQLAIRGMKQIEVSTVDGFQGREKHIVIMSCVRAVSGSLGFVGNRNRMNVALTRAKYAMYLVGHFGALESSDEWRALIADARQRQKIVSVSIDTYAQDITHCLKTK